MKSEIISNKSNQIVKNDNTLIQADESPLRGAAGLGTKISSKPALHDILAEDRLTFIKDNSDDNNEDNENNNIKLKTELKSRAEQEFSEEPSSEDSETDDDDEDDEDDSVTEDLEYLRSILRSLQQILLFIAAGTFSFILLYTAFYINVLRKIYSKNIDDVSDTVKYNNNKKKE